MLYDMKYGSLILEKKEYVYLKRILNVSAYASDFEVQRSLLKLSEELKSAHIVDKEDVPDDVIRLNSKVTVVSDSGWERTLQVVVPMEKDLNLNKISILAPMGAALIGYSKNDTITWDFPSGTQQLKITNVAQEEMQNGIDIVI
jgi:regulator of nucleoside diphosphate kinase